MGNNKPRYQTMLDKLRASIADTSEFLFFIHTTLGTIKLEKVWHRFPGFVAVEGEDEKHKFRFLVFSEETICSFPLEVQRKGTIKEAPGFKSILEPTAKDKS